MDWPPTVINTQGSSGVIRTVACMDKAGSYGIQEWIGMVAVERIEGDFYNVMGLPVARIYKEIVDFIKYK